MKNRKIYAIDLVKGDYIYVINSMIRGINDSPSIDLFKAKVIKKETKNNDLLISIKCEPRKDHIESLNTYLLKISHPDTTEIYETTVELEPEYDFMDIQEFPDLLTTFYCFSAKAAKKTIGSITDKIYDHHISEYKKYKDKAKEERSQANAINKVKDTYFQLINKDNKS